jgi:hypothetical protein
MAREIDYSCQFCGRDHAKRTFNEWWQCPFMRREPLSDEEVQLQMASQIKGDMARRQRDREELQRRAAISVARWDARQPMQKSLEERVAEEMDKLKAWAQAHVAEQITLKVRAAKNA